MLALVVLLTGMASRAQVPQRIAYQAVIRNASGAVIANEQVQVQVKFRKSNANGEVMYSENHTVTTTPQGLVSLQLGTGTVVSGNFSGIPWNENIFLEVLVKRSSDTNFTSMGTSQIVSVPYAFMANRAESAQTAQNGISSFGNPSNTVVSTGAAWVPTARVSIKDSTVIISPKPGHDPEKPIFAVTNSQGQVVMAVYESGVRFYVEESSTKGAKGGFAVGGLTGGKAPAPTYFQLEPGYAQFLFDQNTKGAKGGFAVGGLTGAKSTPTYYLSVQPNQTKVFFDNSYSSGKGAKGGFAVGGLTNEKATAKDYFAVTPDSTYIANTMVSYSNIIVAGNVTTNVGISEPPLTDVEGNTYRTVKIGNQVWMAENLRTKKYSDGAPISPSHVYAFSNPDSLSVFGNFYTHSVVIDDDNVCPDGWRVPSKDDWNTLLAFVGGPQGITNYSLMFQKIVEPYAEKRPGIDNWNPVWTVMTTTNETGFSARGAGTVVYDNEFGVWTTPSTGHYAMFWVKSDIPEIVMIDSYSGNVTPPKIQAISAQQGLSIRCVKN